MNKHARALLLGAAITFLSTPGSAIPQVIETRGVLPSATLAGNSRFKQWGLEVYDAALWVEPGFKASEYERHVFALELTYLRDFNNQAITSRSLDEMRRLGNVPPALRTFWEARLREAFPDIRRGDRITGIHRPGEGAEFITNGRATGAIRDAEFARLFFGIWLSANTSQPRLREALLARLPTQ